MEIFPLPLFNNMTVSYTPLGDKITYQSSAVSEFIATTIRNKPLSRITISSYIPKLYFKPLDDWVDAWNGKPFLWQGLVWVLTKYESTYLTDGSTGNITIELLLIRN